MVQENFAWMADNRQEKKMIKIMKKGSRIMVTGHNQNGFPNNRSLFIIRIYQSI